MQWYLNSLRYTHIICSHCPVTFFFNVLVVAAYRDHDAEEVSYETFLQPRSEKNLRLAHRAQYTAAMGTAVFRDLHVVFRFGKGPVLQKSEADYVV